MIYKFKPIGIIHSCFREKFGIPRQACLVPEAEARLEMLPPYNRPEAFRGLDGFSHVLLSFVFHERGGNGGDWQPTVRPPRLGGNARVGVFASRSPCRPNPLGISVVELGGVEYGEGRLTLLLKGVDLLDQTPVLDIKPYVPYADCPPGARGGYAEERPRAVLPVRFSERALAQCAEWESRGHPGLRGLVTRLLELDPRPACRNREDPLRMFGMKLLDFDVRWRVREGVVLVTEILPLESGTAKGQGGHGRNST